MSWTDASEAVRTIAPLWYCAMGTYALWYFRPRGEGWERIREVADRVGAKIGTAISVELAEVRVRLTGVEATLIRVEAGVRVLLDRGVAGGMFHRRATDETPPSRAAVPPPPPRLVPRQPGNDEGNGG